MAQFGLIRAGLRAWNYRLSNEAFTAPRSIYRSSAWPRRGSSRTPSMYGKSVTQISRINLRRSPQIIRKIPKHGFAPPGALLAALWGDKPRRKAPASLVFGSGAYVHRSTVGSRVVDLTLLVSSKCQEPRSTAFHTLFFQVQPV